MKTLKGYQRKYLRGLAHSMKPVVFIGHRGITESVIREINDALSIHELIKVKFVDFKEKDSKKELSENIEATTSAEWVGTIGHVAIFYRCHQDSDKRKITIPGLST
jgi:RNA-binding protein